MMSNTINDAVTMQDGAEGALLANRYRIVRQLGQGGMGSVWLAEDTQLDGKQFAIKMLPSILVSNKRAYNQLKSEALVAMKLTHPNIVTLRAFEENNGNPFHVMDYIDGQTLDDYLAEKGKLSEDETIKLLKPIAAALDYAHGEGVVHRDVKPANVMIRKDGHPYILDFGIAREIQETMTRVTGKLSSGTLLYMSPEQLNGEKPTPAQDIYSFAAMAYECLKGEPPFVRGAIEDQIKNKEPPSLVGSSVSIARFAESVMAGLAKKPDGRPSTCAAVLNVVDRGVKERNVRREASVASSRPELAVSHAQADCVRLMADAKVVQRHITRFSDDPDCKKDILEIEDDFVRADAIFAERQWALAAECYARIVERGKAMEEGVARRAAEEKARHEAEEKARRDAQELASRKAAEEAAACERLAALHKTGDVKTLVLPGGAKMEMIYCAPGEFMMGNDKGFWNEAPEHAVRLSSGFWLGKYAVTQNQWMSVMKTDPSFFKGENRPVELVSWSDCQEFILKINSQLDCGARLPTEAEWEYACRAGTAGDYGGTGKLDEMGWYDNTILGLFLSTHPVGQKQSNAWGFYDMHGNVNEWCNDWYEGGYYTSSPKGDPQGPAAGSFRAMRGGAWNVGAQYCRSSYRFGGVPGYHSIGCGFRLCCDRINEL